MADSSAGTEQKAVLKDVNNKQVVFEYQPGKINVSHAAKLGDWASSKKGKSKKSDKDSAGLDYEARIKEAGATTLGLSELIFFGPNVAQDCQQLLAWTNADTKDKNNPKLPPLFFRWGPTLVYTVNLIQADITYVRFTAGGKPVRANVNLKLNILAPPPLPPRAGAKAPLPPPPLPPKPQNPTSRGIPGRRGHTLVAGENLQHIAMANYGRPGAWRALAAVNGIEDPLAVLPGTVIYLPAATELTDGNSQ
jgi:hypothetical protein